MFYIHVWFSWKVHVCVCECIIWSFVAYENIPNDVIFEIAIEMDRIDISDFYVLLILLTSCIYPKVRETVGAPLKTSQPNSSIPPLGLSQGLSFRPVHSRMLSSHLFLCLPLALCPCTVPCKMVLASPCDLTTCPYHFSLHFFTVVSRSSKGPMECWICFLSSSLVMWSLYQMPRCF